MGTPERITSRVRGSGRRPGRVWPRALGHSVRTSHGTLWSRCLHRCREDGKLRCPAGASLWLSEVRQENAFTRALPSIWPIRPIVSAVRCGNNAWREAAKGDRARRVSAVRRLLPPPAPVPLERKPTLLGPIRWVDVAGRALRRTWMTHWRRQYVEILPLVQIQPELLPPPRPPRAIRSHHRWSWQDRLNRNASFGPLHLRVSVAGVPTCLAMK